MAHKQAEQRTLLDAENFSIRKATTAERDEVRELFERYVDPHWWPLPDRSLTIVAIDKQTGKLVGGVERDINNIENHYAGGGGLVVLPDFQHKGIGTALFKAMERELEAMGVTRIEIYAVSEYGWRIARGQGYEYDEKTRARLKEGGLPEDRFVKNEKLPMTKEFGRKPDIQKGEPQLSSLQRKPFEKAAQDIGEAKRQVTMLVTWGCHTPERQFTKDVAEFIEKNRGERDMQIHELKSFTHWNDIADAHYERTGRDYSDRKQFAMQKTEHFRNLRAYNEMLRVAKEEGASAVVDLHHSPGANHAEWQVYRNSKPSELKSNPFVYVDIISKEVFEEYSKIPDINIVFKDAPPGVRPLKRVDRVRAYLGGFEYRDEKSVENALRERRFVQIEAMVFHPEHKKGEECVVTPEEYREVVAGAADAVMRIYDHFNSKMLKKEQPARELETAAGIVKRTKEPGIRDVGKFYGVILKPSDSPEERKTGSIYVISKKVGDVGLEARRVLIKDGLREDDVIAEIFGFTPFWELTKSLASSMPDVEKPIQERFLHKGVGTAAMRLLLDELKSEGVAGAYCRTGVSEMQGLLKKFEFREICETAYFKRF